MALFSMLYHTLDMSKFEKTTQKLMPSAVLRLAVRLEEPFLLRRARPRRLLFAKNFRPSVPSVRSLRSARVRRSSHSVLERTPSQEKGRQILSNSAVLFDTALIDIPAVKFADVIYILKTLVRG